MKQSLVKIFIIISCLLLCACYHTIKTEKNIAYSKQTQHLSTKPIYFIIDNKNHKSVAYFTLVYNISNAKYFIKLYWSIAGNHRPNIFIENSLKFIFDDKEFSLNSKYPPRITQIAIEPSSIEEEAIYEIERANLEKLAEALRVNFIVQARAFKLKAHFIRKHTFNGFMEFLDKVDHERSDI